MLCSKPLFLSSSDLTKSEAFSSKATTPFPCGQCFHCRINQARIWTHRLLLENFVSVDSCFVTLTYNEECYPWYGQLEKDEYQKYIKRIRKCHSPGKIRYFGVGEYGDTNYRPHYHLMLFSDIPIDRQMLDTHWQPRGFTLVGEVTKESARYIVGYTVQKLTKRNDVHVQSSVPEFMTCSKHNGGLGIGAIKHIAKELKANRFFNGRNVNSINFGKKEVPLGRYLFHKLAKELDTDYRLIVQDYCNHTSEYIKNYYPEDSINPFAHYMKNFLDDTEAKRHSRENKHKIYKSKRSI